MVVWKDKKAYSTFFIGINEVSLLTNTFEFKYVY